MAHLPMSQVELHFQCRELTSDGVFQKSDPIVVVYFERVDGSLELIGKTEQLTNTQNPDWAVSITVDYFFEEEQKLICRVLHRGSDDPIGQYSFALGKLIAAKGQKLSGNLTRDEKTRGRGIMTIHGEVVDRSNKVALMSFSCVNLPKTSRRFICRRRKPVPSLIIRRVREDGEWVKVSETGATERSCDPAWGEFEANVGRLCNGDLDRPLKIEVVDVTSGNDNPPILSGADTTLRALEKSGDDVPLKHATKPHKSGGVLRSNVRLMETPSFLDYLSGGLELNLHIGIDFTASNGNPMDPKSLHCLLDPNTHNQYQQVIQSVGSILQHYDSDQMYPVWGFGAKPDQNVSHCFPCNPDGSEVFGLDGIHKAYLAAVQRVQFSGPTLFAPMIDRLNAQVQSASGHQAFHIMLILTDGCIHDMEQTIDAIVRSSYLPISLIIVGIGDADFSKMDALDADEARLKASNGDLQQYDNVQFVPYSACGHSAARLAREVLMELPQQVVTYFKARKIPPAPRDSPWNTVLDGKQAYVTACAPPASVPHPHSALLQADPLCGKAGMGA